MNNLGLFEILPEGFRLATKEDFSLVTLTLAQAFADYKYPVPSIEVSHSASLRYHYELCGGCVLNALENGAVLTNEDFSAVLLVTPYNKRANINVDSLYDNVKSNASEEAAKNMVEIFDYIDKGEKDISLKDNTVYVEMFAVQTPRQGQKLGSKLMRELFSQCVKNNKDIFLFTNTERNNSIYNHFGFETIKKIENKELNSTTYYLLWKSKGND